MCSPPFLFSGSIEQSPKLMDRFRHDHLDSDYSVAHGDTRLKEDLADAMRESPSVSTASKESGKFLWQIFYPYYVSSCFSLFLNSLFVLIHFPYFFVLSCF